MHSLFTSPVSFLNKQNLPLLIYNSISFNKSPRKCAQINLNGSPLIQTNFSGYMFSSPNFRSQKLLIAHNFHYGTYKAAQNEALFFSISLELIMSFIHHFPTEIGLRIHEMNIQKLAGCILMNRRY